MPYCEKCGSELSKEDLFCPMCGTKNEYINDVVSEAPAEAEAAAVTEAEAAASEMTKEESIAFAEKLGDLYKSYERLKKEIEDNKSQLSKNRDTGMTKTYSAFRFFWPYLIYAAVSLEVCYFIGSLLSNSTGLALFFMLGALVLPIVFLAVGGTRARRLRDESNRSAIEAAQNRRKHMDDLKSETAALDRKAAKKAAEIKTYDSMIPLAFRNSASMAKTVLLLRSNKAETFTEAIEMLRKV